MAVSYTEARAARWQVSNLEVCVFCEHVLFGGSDACNIMSLGILTIE